MVNLCAKFAGRDTSRKKGWKSISLNMVIRVMQLTVGSHEIRYNLSEFDFVHPGPDGSLVHRCNYCQNHFKTKEEKEAHMVSTHKERFTCNICGKFFQKPNCAYSCQRSHRTELVEKQTFVCVKCGRSFQSSIFNSISDIHD